MSLSGQQAAILNIVFKAKPALRNALLKNADKQLICSICECVLNILHGNVSLKPKDKKKLSKHRDILRKLAQKSKGGWKSKKRIIQKGGNILIPLLAPIIVNLLLKLL